MDKFLKWLAIIFVGLQFVIAFGKIFTGDTVENRISAFVVSLGELLVMYQVMI